MTPQPDARRWVTYTTDTGRCPLAKEIEKNKLETHGVSRLKKLQDRHLQGRTVMGKDYKPITSSDVLWELILDHDNRTFRNLYVHLDNGNLLSVLFTVKKVRRLPPETFRTAERRARDWFDRHPEHAPKS